MHHTSCLVEKAFNFARQAHAGQMRKYTNEPYIVHPEAVARTVSTVTDDEEMIASALLHDVVEDTDVCIEDIREHFGTRVAELVEGVSDVSVPEDGNRKRRKAIDRVYYAQVHPDAKTIKLADIIDNIPSVIAHDPGFAPVYMQEKKLLLGVLRDGNRYLFKRAQEMVEKYYT